MTDTKIKKKSRKIKAMLIAKGIRQNELAKALKVSKQMVSHCLNISGETGAFLRRDPYTRKGIARHLGVSYKELWGENFPIPYGKPKEKVANSH